uniref:Uncharacterized protein n=1 Tax=Parascaris univalens TaxID=6257 RepID=A0A915A8K6_PARUN
MPCFHGYIFRDHLSLGNNYSRPRSGANASAERARRRRPVKIQRLSSRLI